MKEGADFSPESSAKPAKLRSSHLLGMAILFSQQVELKILSLPDHRVMSRIVLLGLHNGAFRVSAIRRHTRMLVCS
jgi:hypothetical protein